MQEKLRLLQKEQMKVMDEIHEICSKNGIEYYIIAGTLLGSIRHKGFIPWDVDMDVAMTRPNYNKFKEICECMDMSSEYKFIDFTKDKMCHTNHGFFCDCNSHLNSVGGGSKYGVFIDIFPLDKAPEDEQLRKKHASRIKFLRKWFYYSCRSFEDSGNLSFIKKIPKYVIRFISKFYSIERLNYKIDSVMQMYNDTDSNILCSMCSKYSYEKQCMDKSIYGVPTLLNFEDKQYYGVEQPKVYLTRLYGNYMKMPSIEEQNKYLGRLFSK